MIFHIVSHVPFFATNLENIDYRDILAIHNENEVSLPILTVMEG